MIKKINNIVLIILIILFIVGCVLLRLININTNNTSQTETNPKKQETIISKYEETQDKIYKEYKTDYNLRNVLKENEDILKDNLDISKLKVLNREEAEALYDIKDFEITVLQSTEGSFSELCSIKIQNTDKTVLVLNLVTKRIKEIKNSHPEFSKENQFAIELNKGIITFVAIEDGAQRVSDVITSSLKEE